MRRLPTLYLFFALGGWACLLAAVALTIVAIRDFHLGWAYVIEFWALVAVEIYARFK